MNKQTKMKIQQSHKRTCITTQQTNTNKKIVTITTKHANTVILSLLLLYLTHIRYMYMCMKWTWQTEHIMTKIGIIDIFTQYCTYHTINILFIDIDIMLK